jgi:radical SAM protein with 4Fe4S-binding SPASM domain
MTRTLKSRIPLFERLQIESQSNCNRSCWFCPRIYDRSGKYFDANGNSIFNEMPTEKILDLLDQAQAMGFRERVAFYHYSEPLLDRRNVMLAREARRRGMKPYLVTNGDVLRHDDALCDEVRRVYTRIVVGLYDYRTNEELAAAKLYWQDKLAGTIIEFSPIGMAGARSAKSVGVPRALVPSDSRMAVPDLRYSNAPCHRPLIRMLIQHDGEMCHCCEDTYGAFQLGNVYERSLEELWFSERHVEITQNLIDGRRDNYDLCRNCPMPPTASPSKDSKIDIAPRRYKANQ